MRNAAYTIAAKFRATHIMTTGRPEIASGRPSPEDSSARELESREPSPASAGAVPATSVQPRDDESLGHVSFRDSDYPFVYWTPETGSLGGVFAYDTETEAVSAPSVVPGYVLGTAFNGSQAYAIRREDLADFWRLHRNAKVFMHTAAFDIAVSEAAGGSEKGGDLHAMIAEGIVLDVSILYRLWQGATVGTMPPKFNLALISHELLGTELEKDDAVRLDFGRFLSQDSVDYAGIPSEHLAYAVRDAIATYQLGVSLEPLCRKIHEQRIGPASADPDGREFRYGLLGHDIQLKAEIALKTIERNGIGVDAQAVSRLAASLDERIAACRNVLAIYGYRPGVKGNRTVFDRVITGIERVRGVTIPLTPKSHCKSQAADDLAVIADDEFVAAFLGSKELTKLSKSYLAHMQSPGGRVHPRYTTLVTTGRTSCSSPNVQNIPREGGIRECFVPSPGHVFISCDYRALELCTLAQTAYSRYGQSAMRDLINQGVDLHRHVAAMVMNKPEAQVTAEERQKAKAIDFGLPGGMGVRGLLEYAAKSYGVQLALEEAAQWRTAWLALFPEMQVYLHDEDRLAKLAARLGMEGLPSSVESPQAAAALMLRVAGGHVDSTAGRAYSPQEIDWAWRRIAKAGAGRTKELAADIAARRGSSDLQDALDRDRVVTIPTGRVRAGCSYTESCNWPFQALAADGAKLALYRLERAGYRTAAFIHDEVLVEVPEAPDYRDVAEDVSRIMVEAMREVCPDVEIRTECAVMRRWSKHAQATCDPQGRLVPCEDAT